MLQGKTGYSWQVPAIHDGDPENFTNFILDLGFDAVELKGANGPYEQYASKAGWGPNIRSDLVQELRSGNVDVRLWHFVYGTNPTGELAIARKQCDKFNPSVYVWDSEGAFELKANAVANARYLGAGLKASHPHIQQVLCTWALPKSPSSGAQWHPLNVINAWLENVDAVEPMMYWQGSSPANAIQYYQWSMDIWRSITQLPIIPVGRSYDGDGGYANAPAISAFADRVVLDSGARNIPGISWYSLDEAFKNPSWLDALRESPGFSVQLTDEEKLNRLVDGHPELFPELFP